MTLALQLAIALFWVVATGASILFTGWLAYVHFSKKALRR